MDVEALDDVAVPDAWSKQQATIIFVGGLLALALAMFGLGSIVSDDDQPCIGLTEAMEVAEENPPVNITTCGGALVQTPIG